MKQIRNSLDSETAKKSTTNEQICEWKSVYDFMTQAMIAIRRVKAAMATVGIPQDHPRISNGLECKLDVLISLGTLMRAYNGSMTSIQNSDVTLMTILLQQSGSVANSFNIPFQEWELQSNRSYPKRGFCSSQTSANALF